MDSNKSYTDFASVYDALTGDVEYSKRCDYLEKIFEKFLQDRPVLIADLGCGTGSVCSILAERGYDMIGIDSSEEMLMEAAEKKAGKNILYLNQDMCDFELYGTVDVMLSMLDSINYILEPDDLQRMFELVHNYLNPEGLFVFDVNTFYKFSEILGDNIFVGDEKEVFYTWENSFDGEYCDFRLNFFVNENGSYNRFTEEHSQRYYAVDELKSMLSLAGFETEAIYGELTFSAPEDEEQRIFLVARAKK